MPGWDDGLYPLKLTAPMLDMNVRSSALCQYSMNLPSLNRKMSIAEKRTLVPGSAVAPGKPPAYWPSPIHLAASKSPWMIGSISILKVMGGEEGAATGDHLPDSVAT